MSRRRREPLLHVLGSLLATLGLLLATTATMAQEARAYYIANEGIMVTRGETKILFDPLFTNDYGQYRLPPPALEAALLAGRAPFDGVDAVFISHYHGDHFSASAILRLMLAQPGLRLYAPMQAVLTLRAEPGGERTDLLSRVTAVSLAYGDAPVTLAMAGLEIEAVRIPHSGWPTGRVEVENLAWRVTLNGATTIVHLGDADPNDQHFALDAEYWARKRPQMAFPPDWFLDSSAGQQILRDRIRAQRNVGIHVPAAVPGDPLLRAPHLRAHDLFTTPGETRRIPVRD